MVDEKDCLADRVIVIISPHVDDAWFCLGGSIVRWREEGCAVYVLNVFSLQAWTKNGNDDPREVSLRRHREELRNAESHGVSVEFLDLPEAQLRGYKEIYPREVDWSIDRDTLNRLTQLLDSNGVVSQASQVLFPLGLGKHVDHTVVHLAGTLQLSAGRATSRLLGFYEDIPYAVTARIPDEQIRSLRLVPHLETIDVNVKKRAVANYESQIDEKGIKQICLYSQSLTRDGSAVERLWIPSLLLPF